MRRISVCLGIASVLPGGTGKRRAAGLAPASFQRIIIWSQVAGSLLAGVIVAAGVAAADPPPSFYRVDLPSRITRAQLAAIADITGDGSVDLLVGSDSGLHVLPGNGTLQFPNWSRAMDDVFVSLHAGVADFNRDGLPDVLSVGSHADPGHAYNPAFVFQRLLLAEPGGRFRAEAFPESAGFTGDFNGDGNPDVLHMTEDYVPTAAGPQRRFAAHTYLGDGAGHFAEPIHTIFDSNFGAAVYYVGDLNGDGAADLVMELAWGELEIVLADGAGGFRSPIPLLSPSNPSDQVSGGNPALPIQVAAGNFNGDGFRDLATRWVYDAVDVNAPHGFPYQTSFSALYVNNGTGGFAAPVLLAEPLDHRRSGPAYEVVMDANEDGRDDLVLTTEASFRQAAQPADPAVDVYLNAGGGAFRGPVTSHGAGGSLSSNSSGWFVEDVLTRPRDLDGDGHADLITQDVLRDGFNVARGDGAGHFTPAAIIGAFDKYWGAPGPAVGDFDGDGNVDVAVAHSGSGNVSVWLGDGRGAWAEPMHYQLGERETPSSIIAADLNGDGIIDLATASAGHGIWDAKPGISILSGDGHGHFALERQLQTNAPLVLATADFDGDGRVDLAVADNAERRVDIFYDMPGATRQVTLRDTVNSSIDVATFLKAGLAVADFDRNGVPDLVLSRNASPAVLTLFLNVGDPSRARVTHVATDAPAWAVAAGDLDGDGNPDLAIVTWNDSLLVARGDGTGGFGSFTRYSLGSYSTAQNVAIADLDGHGQRAVVIDQFGPYYGLQVRLADSVGHLDGPINIGESITDVSRLSVLKLALADLNHDGQLDVVRPDAVFLSRGVCGNGRVEGAEECDDGNTIDCDGCSATCRIEPGVVCGDGVLSTVCGEQCDDGQRNSDTVPDACRTTCRRARCGDGVADGNEQCDDGNTLNCDGCSATCRREVGTRCGDGIVNAACGEQCDAGGANSNAPDACRPTCRLPRCGDGVPDTGEECDDGNTNECDGCSSTCTLAPAVCGDGILNRRCGEQCDDGNTIDGDACSSTCQLELIPGGGAVTTDCLTEWLVVNPHNTPLRERSGRISFKQTCRDNDPTCDFDGGVVGSCTFHVAMCVNVSDRNLPRCTPRPLTRFDLLMPSLRDAGRSTAAARVRALVQGSTQGMLAVASGTCTAAMDVTVPLTIRSGRMLSGKQTLRTSVTSATRSTDIDTLMFTCAP